MFELGRKALLIGIGTLSLTTETAKKFTADLAKKGELTEDQAKEFTNELIARGEREKAQIRSLVEEHVRKLLAETGVATQSDIQRLEDKIASLARELESRANGS
jgi:polyhydroxyalkanoate synthesis regulator phasin